MSKTPDFSGSAAPSPRHRAALARWESLTREIRALEAARFQALALAADTAPGRGDIGARAFRAEAAVLIGVSEYQVEGELSLAYELCTQFPKLGQALGEGRISVQHARKLTQAAAPIGNVQLRVPEAGAVPQAEALVLLREAAVENAELIRVRRAQFEEAMLPYACELTPNQLVPIARKLVEEWTVDPLEERHRRALALRSVRVYECDDGMADVVAHVPIVAARAIEDRVTRIAKHMPTDDTRSMDERRADAFVATTLGSAIPGAGGAPTVGVGELLLPMIDVGGAPQLASSESGNAAEAALLRALAVKAKVQLVVRVDALDDFLKVPPDGERGSPPGLPSGVRQGKARAGRWFGKAKRTRPGSSIRHCAELAGYGPITIDAALPFLVSASTWDMVGVHPKTGAVLTSAAYRPPAHIRRLLEARDPTCRFPGCRAPVYRADFDHTIPASHGGRTSTDNLKALCRGHHSVKHHGGWSDTQYDDGVIEWTSPLGHRYFDRPADKIIEDRVPGHLRREPGDRRPAKEKLESLALRLERAKARAQARLQEAEEKQRKRVAEIEAKAAKDEVTEAHVPDERTESCRDGEAPGPSGRVRFVPAVEGVTAEPEPDPDLRSDDEDEHPF